MFIIFYKHLWKVIYRVRKIFIMKLFHFIAFFCDKITFEDLSINTKNGTLAKETANGSGYFYQT
ncbi:hypothetical protein AT15_03110 [Kosmotoga arenicorallina S304]|uniref:Uncharacterized protein n=1 Tax=Kosmotoga arenicorallina S304 TaxID=1453497 RepID=A0A182C7X0_9BACT|nr:hypothetical protein AT15_03110 [Kosmotoga arenicorallina S304]